jgi:hypothetical protein
VPPPVAFSPPFASPASAPVPAPPSKTARTFFVSLLELHDWERTTTPAQRVSPKYFFTRNDYLAYEDRTSCVNGSVSVASLEANPRIVRGAQCRRLQAVFRFYCNGMAVRRWPR